MSVSDFTKITSHDRARRSAARARVRRFNRLQNQFAYALDQRDRAQERAGVIGREMSEILAEQKRELQP